MAAPILMVYAALFDTAMPLDRVLQPRNLARLLRATWPALVVCSAILITGLKLSTTFAPGGTTRWSYLLTQPFVIAHYAAMFVLPVSLSADTDWRPVTNPFDPRVLVGLCFIAAALWVAAAAWRRRETRPVAFGILWFFLALLPTSSIVPLAEVLNDHRMYFPFVGLTLAATWAVGLLLMNRPGLLAAGQWTRAAVIGLALAVLLAHAAGTWHRNVVWRTEESLWLDVTRASPANARGLMTYGVIQMGKGQFDVANDYFQRALKLAPQYGYLHVNIGVLDGARGDPVEAERHFRLAQQYDPGNPVSYVYYGRWLHSVGRNAEALALARHALELSPADIDARTLLDEMTAAASRAPTAEDWLAASLAHYQAGRYQDSIDASRQALRLRPMYAEAFNNLCAAENMLGRFDQAAADCRGRARDQAGFSAGPQQSRDRAPPEVG